MTRYAVIGDPVSHSKSPLIHAKFAEQTGEDVQYEKISVSADELDTFVQEFFSSGGGGLNVTVPHKEAAFKLADQPSDRARLAQAANTLWMDADRKLIADNTDGVGLVRDLTENLGVSLAGKSVLILGAGGSVRGFLSPLIESNPAEIMILNRTLARAEALVKDFEHRFPLQINALDYAPAEGFDVILNATSSSIAGELPPLNKSIVGESCLCYDLMYSDKETVFMQWATQQGSSLTVDGLGMLVEQAAESFALWRGVRPDTRAVRALLR